MPVLQPATLRCCQAGEGANQPPADFVCLPIRISIGVSPSKWQQS